MTAKHQKKEVHGLTTTYDLMGFQYLDLSSQITVYNINEKNNLDLDLAILSALLKGKVLKIESDSNRKEG